MNGINELGDVSNQAWAIYRDFYFIIPDAPAEIRDLVDAVIAVQDALRWVDKALVDSAHPLSASGPDAIYNVVTMCNGIRRTLGGVEKLVSRYQRIAGTSADIARLGIKLWEKLKWQVEKKTVVELTSRLRMHTFAVNLYMSTISGVAPHQVEEILDDLFTEVDERRQRQIYDDVKLRIPPVSEVTKRKPVELAASMPTFAVELDSVEIPRPTQFQGYPPPPPPPVPPQSLFSSLPEVDTQKMNMAQMDPAILEEKMVVEEVGLDVMLQHEMEEKIVVDEIMLNAERFLAQQGFQRMDRRISMRRRGSRRNIAPVAEFNKLMVTPNQLQVIEEPIAVTYTDLPPAYNVYSKSDIISDKFRPGEKISEVFRLASMHGSDSPEWPRSTADWLRIAGWWLLKSILMSGAGGVTEQTFIDLAKASWILTEVVPPTTEQQAKMDKDMQLAYTELWRNMKEAFFKHEAVSLDSFTPSPTALLLLEPMQNEERDFTVDPVLLMEVFEVLVRPDSHVRHRSFVALEFGLVKPSTYPQLKEMNYLLVLTMDPQTQDTRLTIHDQRGAFHIFQSLDSSNIGPVLNETDLNSWYGVEWTGRTVYAGFASLEATVPYMLERNLIRRELLERPTAIFSTEIDKARYVPENTTLNSRNAAIGWVGPGKLKLMEMRRAEDEMMRYREIVLEKNFITTNIPLHVIKIVPSGTNRLTIFWPTFTVPREDIRPYIKHLNLERNINKFGTWQPVDEKWFWDPHIRERARSASIRVNGGVLHLAITFRKMNERACDIEATRESDRMVDIIFRNVNDLQDFVRNAGGTAPWSPTEVQVFKRVSHTLQVHLFRELDGTMRLCIVEAGLYCNFFLDASSSYFVDPEGKLSLWDLIWSPSGNISRTPYTYLPDAVDLSFLDRSTVHEFFAALFPTQSIAILPVTNVAARKSTLTKYLSGRSMHCSAATLLLVRASSGAENDGPYVLRLVICGSLVFNETVIPTSRQESRKLVAVVPFEYHFERTGAKGPATSQSLKITFKKTQEVTVRSYNRERNRDKIVTACLNPEASKKVLVEACAEIEFVVKEVEWDYAMSVLGAKKQSDGRKQGVAYCG